MGKAVITKTGRPLVPLESFTEKTGLSKANIDWGIEQKIFDIVQNSKNVDCIAYGGAPDLRRFREAKDAANALSSPSENRQPVIKKVKGQIQEGHMLGISPWTAAVRERIGFVSPAALTEAIVNGAFKGCDLKVLDVAKGKRNRFKVEWPGLDMAEQIAYVVIDKMTPEAMNRRMIEVINEPDEQDIVELLEEPEPVKAEVIEVPKETLPTGPVTTPEININFKVTIDQSPQAVVKCLKCDDLLKTIHDEKNATHIEQAKLAEAVASEVGKLNKKVLKLTQQRDDFAGLNLKFRQEAKQHNTVVRGLNKKNKALENELKELSRKKTKQ